MATKLASQTITTPAPETVVTPVVKRPIWGRVLDAMSLIGGIIVAVIQGLGPIDWVALGFTPERGALAALIWTALRLSLTFQSIKVVEVRAEPSEPR